MKRAIHLAVLTALSLLGLAQAPSATGPADRVEQEIRQLNEDERQAILKGDVKWLERIFADSFVVTNPFNQFLTKQDVLDRVRSGALAFHGFERHVEYVRLHGDTAIVAGRETGVWAGKTPLAGQSMNLRFTNIWRREGGRWQQIARHASLIQPVTTPATPKP
jgi:ketosteroid isomerase-like protein